MSCDTGSPTALATAYRFAAFDGDAMVRALDRATMRNFDRKLTVGTEQTSVLIFDDLLPFYREVADYAIEHGVFEDQSKDAFPGFKASIPENLATIVLGQTVPALRQTYAIPAAAKIGVSSAFFGIVAKPAAHLDANQSRPHYDHTQANSFAILLYINDGDFGGTGFFKHRPTGYEIITAENKAAYHQAVDAYLDAHGIPQGYSMIEDGQYELLEAIPYQANRALVYPSGLLHSGLITPATDLDGTAKDGRLTCSIFLHFQD